ncbi:LacI family repressor for deo operon, udp, cdd, tsx, nupC, and nupG [Sphingomonas naasensis]|uniref:LacI family transcriptional regulator n=1 Tax=Sphingomonas naasensis TaxID=1344951 RepID=A0A4S1WL20_9SPHN|nr:LacI family DNA-binding transcriptional regulator [Sphingomonas naasensis]NIJ21057.1 LacI family repressor for deo operon, udp, cdd, tsx, nupC, and nupG [Sphingomonas naasensis]TGX43433.1 LacI family transcriptional regulator [Sphingomonas naasensis]
MNRPTKPLAAGPPTISSVAALAGVSIATVSRCLNHSARVQPDTRARVQDAVKQLGYSPNGLAQSFRRGRTNIVMVVMPHAGCPFLGDVLAGVREGIAGRYSIVIAEANLAEGSYEQVGAMLVSRQVDGLVLLATRPPFGTGLEDLARARHLPIVIGCESVSDELAALPSVQIDNFAAAHEATRHLIDLGHRRIAFVGGPLDKLVTRDRERGYRAAMAESGLSVPEAYVQAVPLSTVGGATAAARLLEAGPRPSATFCGNDEMALGAMDAYRRAGLRIPEDMSVMGFDDIRYAAIASPPLSTVAQPAHAIGRRVAARIIEEIEGGAPSGPAGDVLPYRLMIRQSTGPCQPPRSATGDTP